MKIKTLGFYIFRPITLVRRIAYAFYELRHPDEPWLSPKSVRFIENTLTPSMKLFEWGSGRSTLWFSRKVQHIVSIEYNQSWFDKISKSIESQNHKNIDLRHIPLEHPLSEPTPKIYKKTPKYVNIIEEFPDNHFDLVLVDGHYRQACVTHSIKRIKSGGYLIIDNSNRLPIHDWGVPEDWPQIHQSENVKTQTTIWQKPLN